MRRLLTVLVFAAGLLPAHNFHASLTTMDYRTSSRNLETILVLNADDLEKVVRQRSGQEIELDRVKIAEPLVRDYVTAHLQLRTPELQDVPWHWVGMEVKANFVYVYIEAKLGREPKGLQIRNDLFRDLQPDQVNLLTMKNDGQGKSVDLSFTPGTQWKSL